MGWTRYGLIMRVEDPRARDYYVREAAEQGWSTRALERNIPSGWPQRLLNPPREPEKEPAPTPKPLPKDPYALEFLYIPDDSGLGVQTIQTPLIDKIVGLQAPAALVLMTATSALAIMA